MPKFNGLAIRAFVNGCRMVELKNDMVKGNAQSSPLFKTVCDDIAASSHIYQVFLLEAYANGEYN